MLNPSQAGFIPGRYIADNILLATELLRGYSRSHVSPRCVIKVDIKKAYDSVEWPFLETMMIELGFPRQWVQWIMACVHSVSYSVQLNGIPSKPFQAKKGLRQGDPLSPFLFAISMEYLSRCLGELYDDPDFHFHPKCKRIKNNLMFADDSLLYARVDYNSVNKLCKLVENFLELLVLRQVLKRVVSILLV